MKKFFTLLTLLLTIVGGATSVWAQNAISVTWLPNNMSAITAVGTASVANILTVSNLTYSSDVADPVVATYDSKKWGNFVPTTGTDKNKYSKDDYITFAVTVKTGYTFTPTGVSAYAVGAGTGNNGAKIFATVQTSNGTNAITNSSNASTPTALSLSSFSSTTYSAGQTVYFYIHIGRRSDANKGVCLRDVVLSGTYEDLSTPDTAPSFTTNLPNSDDASVGTEKTLSVVASGKPAPAFQWYICDDTEKTNAAPIDGAITNSYTFTPASTGTYYYYVVASNSEGNATSNVVALTVAAETVATPTFTVYGNKVVKIECATTGATIYYGGSDVKTGEKTVYTGLFIPASSGTIYAYASKTGANDSELASQAITLPVVGDVVGNKLMTLQPEAVPSTDTSYGSNTFTKAGFSMVSTKALKNSSANGYPCCFKASVNTATFTITPPSNTTIQSIKIYGTSNDNAKETAVTAGDGGTIISSPASLMVRNILIGANAVMSEAVMTVDSPSEGSAVSFNLEGTASEARFYVEVYGTTSAATATVNVAKTYTTYIPSYNLDFSSTDKLTAYIATSSTASSVIMTPINKVPAGTPIVLKATELSTDITVNVAATTDDVSANKLKIGDGATSIGGSGKWDYILSDGQFHHASAGVLPAGKCYVHLDAEPAGARESLEMSFEDEATGINDVTRKKEDGRGEYFDLLGRKVAQPTKGLYIVNGKKVVIK